MFFEGEGAGTCHSLSGNPGMEKGTDWRCKSSAFDRCKSHCPPPSLALRRYEGKISIKGGEKEITGQPTVLVWEGVSISKGGRI